ncbi:MAG: peptide chain release factor aRF-1 [Promethearchaeia archaeon]
MDPKRIKLKRKVEQLKELKGRHSSFTTLYIPPEKSLVDVINFVKSELAGAENIKSKTNRKRVIDNLTAILNELSVIGEIPENGMAFFFGIKREGGTEKEIREIVVPPSPISKFDYICGREFVVDELEELTEPKSLVVIVLIEGGQVVVGYLRGNHIELVREEDYYIIGKTRAGGQSAMRYQRIRDEKMMEFYKHVGDLLNDMLLNELESVDAIIVGGNTIRAQEFLEKSDLDYRVREKIVDNIISVGLIDETGLQQAVKEASRVLHETEIYAARKAWDSFMEDLMKSRPTATYGKEEVLRALRNGRVETMMVLEEKTGLIDDVVDEVEDYGTELMIFSPESEAGAQLESFGGVAARLRW